MRLIKVLLKLKMVIKARLKMCSPAFNFGVNDEFLAENRELLKTTI